MALKMSFTQPRKVSDTEVGSQLRVGGDTYPVREQLKAQGFKFERGHLSIGNTAAGDRADTYWYKDISGTPNDLQAFCSALAGKLNISQVTMVRS
jgi:hypothetical protein